MNSKKLSLLALATASLGAATAMPALAQEVMARVINTTAVMQQVAVPRQVCTTQQVIQQSQPSGAGAAMGAIAGGAIGNAIGGGSGRDVTTMLGLVGGALLGNRVEGTRDEVRNVQQCTTQTSYESRVLHYDVVYEYDNKRYSIKMPNDPGAYVRLQVSPVGALPASPTSNTIITGPVSAAPAPTVTYVQAEPIATHTVVSPAYTVVYPPVIYPQARYAPVVPIGLSLNWGYHGGRHHHGRWQ
ncbi:MAG: hypothetical protein WCK08_10905 [Betaproteobacteria bacterium]